MALRATGVRRAGFPGQAELRLVLEADARHLRRRLLTCSDGTEILADLAQPVMLAAGDMLELEDGRLLRIEAAAEPLMEIRGRDAIHLTRLAWHIGNRHLAAEIGEGVIRLRQDRIIAAMLKGLGADVRDIEAPFAPEAGAYHGHGHD